MMCEKCLYRKNCQFLATHKKTIVEDCSVFLSENKLKAQAVKEFAEKLSKRIQEKAATIEHPIGQAIFLKVLLKIINDLSAEIEAEVMCSVVLKEWDARVERNKSNT